MSSNITDYSKCWKCGGVTREDNIVDQYTVSNGVYCEDDECPASIGLLVETWHAIHDRIEAVAQEREAKARLEEREACAREAEDEALTDDTDTSDDLAYNMAIEHVTARIRARGK